MNSNDIKLIIEAGNSAWNIALNTGNINGLAALYAANATLSAGDGKTLAGRSEIENLFNSFVQNGVHNHSLEVIDAGGSDKVIYQVSKWNAYGAETGGMKPSFGGITMSTLVQGHDGKWQISAHVWNVAS